MVSNTIVCCIAYISQCTVHLICFRTFLLYKEMGYSLCMVVCMNNDFFSFPMPAGLFACNLSCLLLPTKHPILKHELQRISCIKQGVLLNFFAISECVYSSLSVASLSFNGSVWTFCKVWLAKTGVIFTYCQHLYVPCSALKGH